MSMSQEEIESLMSGLDIIESVEETETIIGDNEKIKTDELDEMIGSLSNEEENLNPVDTDNNDIDNLLNELHNTPDNKDNEKIIETKNDGFELDEMMEEVNKDNEKIIEEKDFDELKNKEKSIDNDSFVSEKQINEEEINNLILNNDKIIGKEVKTDNTTILDEDNEIIGDNVIINKDVIEEDLPLVPHIKVVHQLNEVAKDGEEKASKIFDVLSYILDENEKTISNNENILNTLNIQIELMNKLNLKFPNVNEFSDSIEDLEISIEKSNEIIKSIEGENNQIFEAMELMQFHDINRQKIERVMTVIRKLSNYLNNLFEDEGNEVPTRKFIHGDDKESMVDDDIDKLIEEFNN